MSDRRILAVARELSASRYRAIPRIALDLTLWGVLIGSAQVADAWWVLPLAAVLIGAFPLHDLLILGHEGTHHLISRNRSLNDLLTWFALGLIGMSGTAHQLFHLDHHRYANTDRDPEYQLFNRVVRGVPGWAYLLIPAVAAIGVNIYALRRGSSRRRARIVLELIGAGLLHAAFAGTLGRAAYLWFVLAPMFTGLFIASVVRTICEHHAIDAHRRGYPARSISTHRLLEFLWSNVNYHLEHHLFPSIPYHQLPALRRLLTQAYSEKGALLERGYVQTTLRLLQEPVHCKEESTLR